MKIEVGEEFRAWRTAGKEYFIVPNKGIFCCRAGAEEWPRPCPWHDTNALRLESDDRPTPVEQAASGIKSDPSLIGFDSGLDIHSSKFSRGVVVGAIIASVLWALVIWAIILWAR